MVASLAVYVITLAVVMVLVTLIIIGAFKVLVYTGVVVNMAAKLLVIDVWTIESFSGLVAGVAVVLEFAVLSGMVARALVVGIGVEVLTDTNINVLTAVMTALEFPMSIP